MCKNCQKATESAGKHYMCKPCWRKAYRNKRKKGK